MGLAAGLWPMLPAWDGFSVGAGFLEFGLCILVAGLVRDLALQWMIRRGSMPTPPPAERMCLCLESILGLLLVCLGLVFFTVETRVLEVPGGLVVLLAGAGVLTSGLVAPYIVYLKRDDSHALAC